MRKFISMFLIMAMLVGIVGTYPITAAANEEVTVPDGIFTTAEVYSINASYNVSTEQKDTGVKVTYADTVVGWARVETQNRYDLGQGVHIEVTDIECTGDYSFAMYFGNMRSGLYDQRGYMMFYENSGKFSIMATKSQGAALTNPKVINAVQVDPLTGYLSIDIKVVGDDCKITVNGNSFTIPAKHEDTSCYIQNTSSVLFSFAILDTISDNTFSLVKYPGATYTIKSIAPITYNVDEVTLDSSSKTMMVGDESSLTASVVGESVSNTAVTWASSDTSIATVDANGNVTAVSAGTVSITATSVADTTKSAACEVKVWSPLRENALSPSGNSTNGVAHISKKNATTGVEVVTTPGAKWSRVYTRNKVSLETGVNIEIGDITAVEEDENYSIVVAIGTNNNQWYNTSSYLLICGASGNIAIVKAPLSGTAPISVDAIDSANIGNLGDSLSISIVKNETDYIIAVNGTELTIENGAEVLNAACCLSFGIMSDITIADKKVNNLNYAGPFDLTGNVSFVINSIELQQQIKAIAYTSTFHNFRNETEMEVPFAPEGYVFAGWYSDAACETTPITSDVKTLEAEANVYARFVPETVLSVKPQAKWTDQEKFGETKIDLRFVTTVDSINYQSVGFEVTDRAQVPHEYPLQYVYESLNAAGVAYKPTFFNQLSYRFATTILTGITVADEEAGIDPEREIPVRAYWITMDGTTVYGPARTVKISEAVENVQ